MSTKQERWALFDREVFRTITGADWAAMFRARDWVRNSVRAHIAQKILVLKLGKSESETVSKKE